MNESLKKLVATGLTTYVVFKVGQLSWVCETLKAFMDRTDEDRLTLGKKMKFTLSKKIKDNQ